MFCFCHRRTNRNRSNTSTKQLVWFFRSRIMGFTDLSKKKTTTDGSTAVSINSPLSTFGEILTAVRFICSLALQLRRQPQHQKHLDNSILLGLLRHGHENKMEQQTSKTWPTWNTPSVKVGHLLAALLLDQPHRPVVQRVKFRGLTPRG